MRACVDSYSRVRIKEIKMLFLFKTRATTAPPRWTPSAGVCGPHAAIPRSSSAAFGPTDSSAAFGPTHSSPAFGPTDSSALLGPHLHTRGTPAIGQCGNACQTQRVPATSPPAAFFLHMVPACFCTWSKVLPPGHCLPARLLSVSGRCFAPPSPTSPSAPIPKGRHLQDGSLKGAIFFLCVVLVTMMFQRV